MSSKQTLEIRLADLRKKLAALSAKESLTEDEQQEVDKLASEYQETESRHKAAIIAEAEQHEQRHAGQEPDRETGEGAEVRRLMQRATIGGYVQAALQNSIGGEPRRNSRTHLKCAPVPGYIDGVVVPWALLLPPESRAATTTTQNDGPVRQVPIIDWLSASLTASWICSASA